MEHDLAVSISASYGFGRLPDFLPISLRLQARLLLGGTRAGLVVGGNGRHSLLPKKKESNSLAPLQSLAPTGLNEYWHENCFTRKDMRSGPCLLKLFRSDVAKRL